MSKDLIVEGLYPLFKNFEFKNRPIEVAGLSPVYRDAYTVYEGTYTLKIYATWLNDLKNYSDKIHAIAIDLYSLVHNGILCKINNLEICESREEIDDIDIIYQKDNVVNIEDFLLSNGFELDTYYQSAKNYCKKITDWQTLCVRIFSDVNTIERVEYEHKGLSKYDKDSKVTFETIDTLTKLKCLLEALL